MSGLLPFSTPSTGRAGRDGAQAFAGSDDFAADDFRWRREGYLHEERATPLPLALHAVAPELFGRLVTLALRAGFHPEKSPRRFQDFLNLCDTKVPSLLDHFGENGLLKILDSALFHWQSPVALRNLIGNQLPRLAAITDPLHEDAAAEIGSLIEWAGLRVQQLHHRARLGEFRPVPFYYAGIIPHAFGVFGREGVVAARQVLEAQFDDIERFYRTKGAEGKSPVTVFGESAGVLPRLIEAPRPPAPRMEPEQWQGVPGKTLAELGLSVERVSVVNRYGAALHTATLLGLGSAVETRTAFVREVFPSLVVLPDTLTTAVLRTAGRLSGTLERFTSFCTEELPLLKQALGHLSGIKSPRNRPDRGVARILDKLPSIESDSPDQTAILSATVRYAARWGVSQAGTAVRAAAAEDRPSAEFYRVLEEWYAARDREEALSAQILRSADIRGLLCGRGDMGASRFAAIAVDPSSGLRRAVATFGVEAAMEFLPSLVAGGLYGNELASYLQRDFTALLLTIESPLQFRQLVSWIEWAVDAGVRNDFNDGAAGGEDPFSRFLRHGLPALAAAEGENPGSSRLLEMFCGAPLRALEQQLSGRHGRHGSERAAASAVAFVAERACRDLAALATGNAGAAAVAATISRIIAAEYEAAEATGDLLASPSSEPRLYRALSRLLAERADSAEALCNLLDGADPSLRDPLVRVVQAFERCLGSRFPEEWPTLCGTLEQIAGERSAGNRVEGLLEGVALPIAAHGLARTAAEFESWISTVQTLCPESDRITNSLVRDALPLVIASGDLGAPEDLAQHVALLRRIGPLEPSFWERLRDLSLGRNGAAAPSGTPAIFKAAFSHAMDGSPADWRWDWDYFLGSRDALRDLVAFLSTRNGAVREIFSRLNGTSGPLAHRILRDSTALAGLRQPFFYRFANAEKFADRQHHYLLARSTRLLPQTFRDARVAESDNVAAAGEMDRLTEIFGRFAGSRERHSPERRWMRELLDLYARETFRAHRYESPAGLQQLYFLGDDARREWTRNRLTIVSLPAAENVDAQREAFLEGLETVRASLPRLYERRTLHYRLKDDIAALIRGQMRRRGVAVNDGQLTRRELSRRSAELRLVSGLEGLAEDQDLDPASTARRFASLTQAMKDAKAFAALDALEECRTLLRDGGAPHEAVFLAESDSLIGLLDTEDGPHPTCLRWSMSAEFSSAIPGMAEGFIKKMRLAPALRCGVFDARNPIPSVTLAMRTALQQPRLQVRDVRWNDSAGLALCRIEGDLLNWERQAVWEVRVVPHRLRIEVRETGSVEPYAELLFNPFPDSRNGCAGDLSGPSPRVLGRSYVALIDSAYGPVLIPDRIEPDTRHSRETITPFVEEKAAKLGVLYCPSGRGLKVQLPSCNARFVFNGRAFGADPGETAMRRTWLIT